MEMKNGKTKNQINYGDFYRRNLRPALSRTAINMTQPYQIQDSKFQISVRESEQPSFDHLSTSGSSIVAQSQGEMAKT